MKKIILAIFLITLMAAGCATTKNIAPIVKKPEISIKRFVATCGIPMESYLIEHLGVKVHRHKNCMGFDDLLSLVWMGDMSKQSVDGILILALTYATHLSQNDENANYLVNLLKIDSFTQDDGETYVAFFQIKRRLVK
mgnify:CR=1 FL=1